MAFTYTNAPVLSKVKIGEQYYYLKDADVRAILDAINANVYEKLKLDLGAIKDENKQNNCLENLEWTTCKENINYGTGIQRGHKKLCNKVKCLETG